MHYLRYEYFSESYPRCNAFKLREESDILAYTIHEGLDAIIKKSAEYPKYDHFFLVDESRCNFFRADIYQEFSSEITVQSLNEFIKQKIEDTKRDYHIDGEVMTSYIDTIYIDGEEKKYLIGKKGQIFFRLYLVFLCKTSINRFNGVYGNVLENPKIHIIPQSLYTLMFLRNTLKKENFVLLYITESYCKAISIKDGFYAGFDTLNLGIASLKQMYKDNGVVQYWYKDYQEIEHNPLAKDLVVETLEFYSELFCKWFAERNLVGTDILVISPITKNQHFMEVFDRSYKKISNNYIVPFHHSNALNSFGKEREPENMDSLVFINQEEKIRKMLLGERA